MTFEVIHRPSCYTCHDLSSKEKTKSLASSVEKLWRTRSRNLKSRSRDPGHAPFGVIHHLLCRSAIRNPNTRLPLLSNSYVPAIEHQRTSVSTKLYSFMTRACGSHCPQLFYDSRTAGRSTVDQSGPYHLQLQKAVETFLFSGGCRA